MVAAARLAFAELLSAPFRRYLWLSLALTAFLFVVLLGAAAVGLAMLTVVEAPWIDRTIDVVAGLGLLLAMVFLAAPVTAAFAGLFLDRIAALVEAVHYAADRPGTPLAALPALLTGLRFFAVTVAVNLLVLPLLLFGIGFAVLLVANAYLIGREYFEMIAMRHLAPFEARRLRRRHSVRLLLSGLLPALLALLPLANLLVPMFATSYFTHVFKAVARREAGLSS
jgi:CysZ protein